MVAETLELAEQAAKMVDIEYTTNDERLPEPSGQEVFSIDAAIAKVT